MADEPKNEEPRRIALLLGSDSQVLILTQPDENAIRIVRAWIRAETGATVEDKLPPDLAALVEIMRAETARCFRKHEVKADAGRGGGLAGKGVPRNAGNQNAAKQKQNNSKTIADQKQGGGKQNHKDKYNLQSTTFLSFWTVWPKKVAKADAERAWAAAWRDGVISDANLDAVLVAVRSASSSSDWTKDGGKWIPHPASWIRGRRWEDESAPAAPSPDGGSAPEPVYIFPRKA